MTVFPSDPIETFSHFFPVLVSAATLQLLCQNRRLPRFSKTIKHWKSKLTLCRRKFWKRRLSPRELLTLAITETLISNIETVRSLQFLSDDEDLPACIFDVLVQLKQITHCLNVLCAHQVEPVGNATDEAEKYSYQFNVKITGLPEKSSNETAPETRSLCVKLFQEIHFWHRYSASLINKEWKRRSKTCDL